MEDKKLEQNLNEKVNSQNENVFTKKARSINPVVYFFISLLNALWGMLKWFADLILSMFTSLWHFIKLAGIGVVKGSIAVANFFKRKAHQFKYNDKDGRMSFFLFGFSALRNKQTVIGILYMIFQVAYIALFAVVGVSTISKLDNLGDVKWGTEYVCVEDNGMEFCDYAPGDNSIMILIYGLLWILSIFVFLFVWNKSIENGYLNHRINEYLAFEKYNKEAIKISNKLDLECQEAYANGVALKTLRNSKQDEINEFLASIEDANQRDYTKYLLLNTFTHSYKHSKEQNKQAKVLSKLENKKSEYTAKRDRKRVSVVQKRDEKLAALPENASEEHIDIVNAIVEKFDNTTMLSTANIDKKIKKQVYVMQELEKRYSCFAEMQHTRNNDRYGKYNQFYKNVAQIDTQLLFYKNYDKFVEIYNTNLNKFQEKNEFNAKELVRLYDEMNEKISNTKTRFAEIRAKRATLEAQEEEMKANYKAEVARLKSENAENVDELLLEAKSKLIDDTTVLMRKLNDLPSEKNVNALEKEEIRESKSAYARDKKYLKTNYTDKEFAKEEVINFMLLEYKIDYKVAVSLFNKMFVVENKESRFLSQEEVKSNINRLNEEKENYLVKFPDKYEGRAKSFKETVNSLLDENFHLTILALPIFGIVFFTIVPLLFSILVAFTNYSKGFEPPTQLFTWVGFDNIISLFKPKPNTIISQLPTALWSSLGWTMCWAVIATFSNYILGIVVALMINKDGIRFKRVWRTVFMMTIAVPQFISLLSLATLIKDNGAVGQLYREIFGHKLGFGVDDSKQGIFLARLIIILVNVWVGIPYTILSTTGILLNIPKDLYESAKVDGANSFVQFTKITMPYILFVTGPYLITQFIGNINNFNVIFFLTGGSPVPAGSPLNLGKTDLLITFLYDLVMSQKQYSIASAIGILIFVICSFISIVMFNKSGSIQEEDQFQ